MLLGQVSIDKGWILIAEDLFAGARNIAALSQEEDIRKTKEQGGRGPISQGQAGGTQENTQIVVLQRRWSAPTRSASMAHV